MDIWPHLELNYKNGLRLGGIHGCKCECIWSVVGIPINLEMDRKVLNCSIIWSFALFPPITNKPCSELQRCLICIHKHPANRTEYFWNWTANGNVYSYWFMTSIICIRNITQCAALIIYIWVPRVMTYFTAAENRKTLLTVTQFDLRHCIFERIIKSKTSFLKKINQSIWLYRKPVW